MKISPVDPPRSFTVGHDGSITIRHCANVALGPDEMVTLVGDTGSEFDVVRKSWGYYATPSFNSRLAAQGLRPALVRGRSGRMYLLLVERGREADFQEYCRWDELDIVAILDSDEAIERLVAAVNRK